MTIEDRTITDTDADQLVHALRNESDVLIPGRVYETLCGIQWEHQPLTADDLRHRWVCALCVDAQNAEFVKALQSLQDAYNRHLETYHWEPTDDA